jgi:ABC-2 type transport system ATP-binding protein
MVVGVRTGGSPVRGEGQAVRKGKRSMGDQMLMVPEAISAQKRTGETVLRTINLTKQYRQHLAVNNLSLEVKQGEIFGFLGLNGAGKTTTIRLVLGLITPTSGNVEIFGKNIATHQAHVLRVGSLIETPDSSKKGAA